MVFPHDAGFTGIARPPYFAGVPTRTDDIDDSVAIDIKGQVDQRYEVRAVFLQVTHFVSLPRRVLVPCVAGEDVRAPVIVKIGYRAGLADSQVDGSALEWNFRAARRKADDDHQEHCRHWQMYSHSIIPHS